MTPFARSWGMTLKPSNAKVIDLDTALDAAPTETAAGPIIWATVTIEYSLAGLNPVVSIRVPVPWIVSESADQRRTHALGCARELIEHVCRAAGVGPTEPYSERIGIDHVIEAITPSAWEGIAQELGLNGPSATAKSRKN